jgi:signal transduction histidine kinase
MAVFGIGGGFWVSRKLLARIDGLSDTTRTIMDGDLAGRLPVNGSGDELDRLAESVNLMLTRIEQLMAGLREVSDNIAHDLKTPLSRLRNRVEAALREPYGEPVYREALERTIEEADGLIKTFNALLSIARLEAGAGGENRESLDVSALLRDVAELYEPVAEERGLELKAETDGAIYNRGDRQLLGQAIANLIDNAIKYGTTEAAAAATEVEVSAKTRGGMAEIVVTDRGPGVPATDRERVLDRFVRLEAS